MSEISKIYNLLDQAVGIQHLDNIRGVSIDILRLDTIDPFISGNKLFKLFEYLNKALTVGPRRILTFGGAYSNHLIATAKVCSLLQLPCTGIVRGEANEIDSVIIDECKALGMEIQFMDRSSYREIAEQPDIKKLQQHFGPATIVPMGGYGQEGVAGAAMISNHIPENTYTHIATSVGTGTTLAGLLRKKKAQKILAYPAIKGMTDLIDRIHTLGVSDTSGLEIIPDFHFGGFAGHNETLICFINDFYTKYEVPLDFVYTGKMMFGAMSQIRDNYFHAGARVLAIHTGGLQGNRSLPEGTLVF